MTEPVRASVPAHLPVLPTALDADAPPPPLDLMPFLAVSVFSWKINCKCEAGEIRFGATIWHPAWPTTAMPHHPGCALRTPRRPWRTHGAQVSAGATATG